MNLKMLSAIYPFIVMESMKRELEEPRPPIPPKVLAERRKKRLEYEDMERKKAQGLKLFNINGVEVWALNQKNAERKAKKLL